MKRILAAALLVLAAPQSLAQTPDSASWTGGKTGISLSVPPGWLPETKETPADTDIIHRPAADPNAAEDACMLMKMASAGVGPDGKPLTQERINRESSPLTVDMSLRILQKIGFKNPTSIEALPTIIVDGKAALSIRALTPPTKSTGSRLLLLSANILKPSALYSLHCIFPVVTPPGQEPADSVDAPTADFMTILKSIRTG